MCVNVFVLVCLPVCVCWCNAWGLSFLEAIARLKHITFTNSAYLLICKGLKSYSKQCFTPVHFKHHILLQMWCYHIKDRKWRLFRSTDLCVLGHGAGLNSIHPGGPSLDSKEWQNARTTTYIQNHLQRQEKKKEIHTPMAFDSVHVIKLSWNWWSKWNDRKQSGVWWYVAFKQDWLQTWRYHILFPFYFMSAC